jgi:CRISPR-associated endonuclease Csn1
MLTLGLDLGTNSIGWALIDEAEQKIIRTGVRVFPEGVDRDQQGGEKSKSQTRRTARGTRRQIDRRARRKKQLRNLLAGVGLLPADQEEFQALLETNPYPLRARALSERLELHDIGRILWHINQRRGFLSNRKTDRGDKEVKGMLAEIGELHTTLIEKNLTLGAYLAQLDENYVHTATNAEDRVRYRHTRREMYIKEFEALWNEQSKHHPGILTDELKTKLYDPSPNAKWICRGIIFGQRRVYWPKSVIGRCDLERKEKRCHRALLDAQRFRIYQEVNNLRLLDRSTGEERVLTQDERNILYEYLDTAKQRTFDQIHKHRKLAFPNPDAIQFNFERAARTKLKGNETNAVLGSKKALGKQWYGLSEATQHRIIDILLNEELEEEALRQLINDCGLTAEQAQAAMGANLPDGHMNYSLTAIRNLLPHLQRGLFLMANNASDSAIHAAGYLRPDEREVRLHDYLPPAPDLPNPIVRQALFEVRKIVNAILREHVYRDGQKLGEIRIELAREAKRSFDQRKEILFENAKRRREREAAASEIEDIGVKPTRAAIQRYILWKEQEEFCPYSQTKIGFTELFTPEVDVDHILPRWRSLDDSMANKVVCRRSANHDKADQTPYEWLASSDPDRYERVLRIADKLPGNKPLKFRRKELELDDFVQRQFTDTAYISRCVTQYLKSIGVSVRTAKGTMTADIRHWWGLNNILDPEQRSRKMRNDHRHHAVDAIVIALMTPKRVHLLANARGSNIPQPWEHFLQQATDSILNINVSHRPLKRLRGALHEASFYGPTSKKIGNTNKQSRPWAKHWIEEEGAFVRRKAITDVKNAKHIEKVRDPAIRSILRAHIVAQGIDPDKKGDYPATVFKGENTPHMPSGVPIRRVRMIERSETFRPVSDRRSFQSVKPGSNHHIVYYEQGSGDDAQWAGRVVTMWDAAKRGRRGLPLVDHADTEAGRFVMSLSIGEMFEMDGPDKSRQLCVIYKMSQNNGRIHYKLHTDARVAGEINADNQYLSPQNMHDVHARKVLVDPLGRRRWAND